MSNVCEGSCGSARLLVGEDSLEIWWTTFVILLM